MKKAVWDLKAQYEQWRGQDVFDCYIAEALLSEGKYTPDFEKALEKYKVKTTEVLAEKQKERLQEKEQLEKLFYEVEMPLVPVLWQMEKQGITLDAQCLRDVGEELRQAIVTLEDSLKKTIGFDINLNSSQQVGNYLAEKEAVPLARTKTGKYATNEQELQKHSAQFPIIQDLLKYRGLEKLRSTYVESLIQKVDDTGRVHTTYHQVYVSTGRLASSNPNLQNIPVTSEFGQKIKSCFTSSDGYTLVSFDYSQQELRILAHLTGEEKLIEAFTTGQDVHKTTASQLFNTPYDEVTKQQRTVGKTINFGIIYGMSSFGMSQGLNIPVEEAEVFIDTFYATYPKIRKFYDEYLKQGKIQGFVTTLMGRRRYVFEYPGQKFIDNSTRRVLMNYPIQGSAADLMKMAMNDVYEKVLQNDDSVRLLLQIHDDLVFEIEDGDKKKLDEKIQKIKQILCSVYPLVVPIEVDVKVGKRWGEMNLHKE